MSQRLGRQQPRGAEHDVGRDGHEEIALDLRVDLLEDAHRVLLARQRRPHELHELAAEVLAGSQQEITQQQHDRRR